MESYPISPGPEQPSADQSAPSRAQSRFVEGSMNDRASNAPPPTFLGPEEMAAYERQFYDDNSHTRSRPTSGIELSFNRNSGTKFWEGIRDKFTRTKSSSSILSVSSSKTKSSNRFSQQSQRSQVASSAPNEKENVSGAGYYPSREEVMENYKNLVDAGFFSSHAIQGTRHRPPPPRSVPKTDHSLPAAPPPAMDAPPAPFSELVAQKQRILRRQSQTQDNPATPALSSIFASIPYSATQPSPTGDAPLTTYARPDPRPPISLPKKYRRPHHPTILRATEPALPTSPSRGTKRAMADMTGGSVDREMTNASAENIASEAGARKLVKKLRKSASRISVDLSLRPGNRAGNGNAIVRNHPYGSAALPSGTTKDVPGATSTTSVDLAPRPPISAAGRAMGSVVRSLSNSFKRDGGGRTAPAAPDNDLPPPPPRTDVPLPATTTSKLVKGKRSLVRRVSLGRSRSISTFSPSIPPAVPQDQQSRPHLQPQPPPIIFSSAPPPAPRPSTASHPGDGDPMVLDTPSPHHEPAAARPASLDVHRPAGGLSVPSFHYPQRRKNAPPPPPLPLAAVPDPNTRALPGVPEAPAAAHFKSGSFCSATLGATVAGEAAKENGEFAVF